MFFLKNRFGRGRWFQVGPARAANRFQSCGDVDAYVELFGLEQTVVGRVEVVALDVETGECEALSGGFFGLFLGGVDLAQAFTQFD